MSLSPSLPITITMQSDWHIGSGAGRPGDVDRLIRRDAAGFPYIPAKTLTGIWRDACELIATGLDPATSEQAEPDQPRWQHWVDYLFGDQPALPDRSLEQSVNPPRPAAFSVRSARLPQELRQALQSQPVLKKTLTFVKPGISIDSQSGCAIEDYLRFEEMVRTGTVLSTTAHLNLALLDRTQQAAAYALLLAGSRAIERMGGKRRRGAGRCQVVLPGITIAGVEFNPIEWLKENSAPPAIPAHSATADRLTWHSDSSLSDTDWITVGLKLTTQSPVVIPARTIGNVVETLDYIPGTYLLRLIVQAFRSFNLPMAAAIAQGDLLVTNATIQIGDQAGQPTPMALFYEKVGGGLTKGSVYNRFLETGSENSQLKGYRGGYIGAFKGSCLPEPGKNSLGIETHNTVEDRVQRPTSDVGGVYSYEAIAPQTRLQAELRLRSSLVESITQQRSPDPQSQDPQWWTCLNGLHRIGQSKKDDYGLVEIQATLTPTVNPELESDANSELAQMSSNLVSGDRLIVWLLADVLLRDERLRPTTNPEHFRQILERELSTPSNTVKLKFPDSADYLHAIAQSHRTESWQVRWGLPRPSLVGIAAGSCLMFQIEAGTVSIDRLHQLEQTGIGDRRVEGYGQLRFNPPLLMQELAKLTPCSSDNTESPSVNTPANSSLPDQPALLLYSRTLERAAYREAIRRAAVHIAADPARRERIFGMTIVVKPNHHTQVDEKVGAPTMSQLGALRSIIRRLRSQSDHVVITAPKTAVESGGWIARIQASKYRKEKWDEKSLEKICTLVHEADSVWNELDTALESLHHPQFAALTLTPEHKVQLQQELWAEAIQTLTEACIQAHKRSTESNNP